MNRIHSVLAFLLVVGLGMLTTTRDLDAQEAGKPSPGGGAKSASPAPSTAERKGAQQYSGTYSFLKDGEFVQLTVEDDGRITGFISRFGDGASDKDAFLDQFFKTGKLEGNKLSFTTQAVHGVDYDFKGSVERGEGKQPGDEAYFVLKGTLTENTTDANKKVTTHSQDVIFRAFPQSAGPPAAEPN
jgi:hypothetical protein